MWSVLIGLIVCFLPISDQSAYYSVLDHDFHMSRCQIAYDHDTQALQVILHIFLDDLESAIFTNKEDKTPLLFTEREESNSDELISSYLTEHLKINVNGEEAKLNFIGREISDDLAAAWCYLEVVEIAELKSMTIMNNILMELFDDQRNIIDITGPKNQRGYFLFHKGKHEDSVSFK